MEPVQDSIDSLVLPLISVPDSGTASVTRAVRHAMGWTQRCSENSQRTAQSAERRLAFLFEISSLLAAPLDDKARLQRLVDLVVSLAADWCAIHVTDANGAIRRLAVAHSASIGGDSIQNIRLHALLDPGSAQHPVARVLRTGKSEWFPAIPDALLIAAASDDRHLALLRAINPQSAIVAPLIVGGRAFGTLTVFSVDAGHRYGPDDLALHEEVARCAAQAIDNSRLSREVQKQAARLHALAEAAHAFAEQCLDAHSILPTITHHIVNALGDLCMVRLLSEDGQWLQPAAVCHPIPRVRGLLRDVLASIPRRSHEGLAGAVIQSGEPVLLSEVIPEMPDAPTKIELDACREHLQVHSILIVPLRVRGRVIGTVGGWRDRPGDPYTLDDQAFVQDLADRAALAIENTRLYQQLVERECRLRELLERQLRPQPAHAKDPLTSRELEVLPYLVQGRTNREIADRLHVSVSTVKAHIEHIIAKLAVSDRTHAAVRAIELGLVSPETPST